MTTARDVLRARRRAAGAEDDLRRVIVAALADGESVAEIARAAGLTRQRIYQIRDENLSDPAPSVGNAP